jgi:tRNA-splicing ligase RtcB
MQAAANFAFANRQVMTGLTVRALLHALAISERDLCARVLYDVCHNVAKVEEHDVEGERRRVLVHRKGATRCFGPGDPRVPAAYRDVGQPVLIPGDMGRYSYVLAGTEKAMRDTFGSSCHGAGRLLSRGEALRRGRGRSIARELAAKGIEVISRGKKTLAEEMSEAYKDVAQVVAVMHRAGISRLVARLEPMGVIKG